MTSLTHRTFEVDYHEKDAHTWTVMVHLRDEIHDITVRLDVAIPELVVRDAEFVFDRGPFEQCQLVRQKAAALRGLDLRGDFIPKMARLFMGPQGCSNIFVMLQICLPSLARFYFPFIMERHGGPAFDQSKDCLAHAERSRTSPSG